MVAYRDDSYRTSNWAIYGGDISKAQLNIVCSLLGYFLFGIILYSTHKKGVLKRFVHNVILILNFAFITDIMEMRMSAAIWALSILVAPLLSTVMLILNCIKKKNSTSNIFAFILTSSLMMGVFVISFLVFHKTRQDYYWNRSALPWYGQLANVIFFITNIMHDFRFLLLCLLAVAIVREIRGAVFSTIVEVVRKVLGRAEHPSTVDNNVFLESLGSYENKPDTGKARHAMLL